MSTEEVDQIGVFEKLKQGEIKQGTAARALSLSVRQVRRKLKDYRKEGASSLIHAGRGKPSNRRLNAEVTTKAVGLVKEKYADFGPTFAAEKLLELDGVKIGKETLRGLMTEAKLWKPKEKKQGAVHEWRERRACLGELVQLDGSYHRWFEERGDACCLLAFIDDATGHVLWAEFCDGESTENLLLATKHYLETCGRPLDLYTDRGGVYKVNRHNPDDERITQYGRALSELSIGLIHARSPQAKGRVERLFGTFQDRLVKELRLADISAPDEGNRFLREYYLGIFNAKFGVIPKEAANLHRSLEGYGLPRILCTKEGRTLQSDHCLSYRKRWLQLEARQPVVLSRKEKVTVSQLLDGTIRLSVRGTDLAFRELPERPAKPLREKQPDLRCRGHVPAPSHPWRRYATVPI